MWHHINLDDPISLDNNDSSIQNFISHHVNMCQRTETERYNTIPFLGMLVTRNSDTTSSPFQLFEISFEINKICCLYSACTVLFKVRVETS